MEFAHFFASVFILAGLMMLYIVVETRENRSSIFALGSVFWFLIDLGATIFSRHFVKTLPPLFLIILGVVILHSNQAG